MMFLLNMNRFKELDRHRYHVLFQRTDGYITSFKELNRHGYNVSDAGETLKAFSLLAQTFVGFLIKPLPNLIL